MAMSRQIFKSGKFSGKNGFRFSKPLPVSNSGQYFSSGGPETLFTPSLIGAVSTAGVLLLLLLVALYKWKQVYFFKIRRQGSHTLGDPLLFSHWVSSLSETKIRDPLEDHWKHWWKQLHLCGPRPATIQLQVGVSQRQATPWYVVLVMGSLQCVKNNNNEGFHKCVTKPFLPRCGTWVRSLWKGCRSNSIWSWKRWCHAGGCQNAETWGLCNHHGILSMYDSSFVTELPLFVATPQQALTRRNGKPWCQSWKFSATLVTTTTLWTCWAPALKEVMLLLWYNRPPYWPMPNPTLCLFPS